jgi:hypothetical protein
MKNLFKFNKILIFLLLFSCNKTDSSTLTEKEIVQLKDDVLKRGSQSSYARLEYYYRNSVNYIEILPYSLVMINKFNSKYSYTSILEVIVKMNNEGKYELSEIKNLNKGDRDFVIYYLFKGVDQEDPESTKVVSELYKYGWGVSKNLKKSDSLYSSYENMMWGK